MPSVRGRQRWKVITALFGSGVLSGAVIGALFGVLLIPLSTVAEPLFAPGRDVGGWPWSTVIVVAMVVVGVGLDVVALVTGRVAPPAIGRQVPREWIDYFSPVTVAVLFGTRLGIGPATILSTWTWWSVTLAAGLLGLGAATAVGAAFGLARGVVTVAGSYAIERRDAGSFMPRLRAGRRPSWAALNLTVLVAALLVLSAGCGDRPNPVAAPPTSPDSANPDSSQAAEQPSITSPVRLEDVVRSGATRSTITRPGSSSSVLSEPQPSGDGPPVEPAPVDGASVDGVPLDGASLDTASVDTPAADHASGQVSLADDLPRSLEGFDTLTGREADRFLSLQDAAALQPDPTEEVALLETRGYRGGWTRAFRNDVNDVAVASVYEFADAPQAEFYLEDGLITIGGYGGSFFDIEGLPGVRGFAQSFDDGDEELLSLGAVFQAGSRWYLLYVVGTPDTVTPDVLVPAVAAQRAAAVGESGG